MKTVYCIDLDNRKLEVTEFGGKQLEEDMAIAGTRSLRKLEACYKGKRRLFQSLKQAETFLKKYMAVKLNKLPVKENRAPMLLKGYYLRQVAMRVKNHTVRHYDNGWKQGTKAYFHNQREFVNVKITAVKKLASGNFKYSFVAE